MRSSISVSLAFHSTQPSATVLVRLHPVLLFNTLLSVTTTTCTSTSSTPLNLSTSHPPTSQLQLTISIPGARFGPRAIRAASLRQTSFRSFNPRALINPYQSWARLLDCGDVPLTPFSNEIALEQMTQAYLTLGQPNHREHHNDSSSPASSSSSSPYKHPKLISLGGDHSLALPALRALSKIHKSPIRVLHFDAHLDTWDPEAYPSHWGITPFTHGSMFHLAHTEGLLSNTTSKPSVHAGLRTRLSGTDLADNEDDTRQNWVRYTADDVDDLGTKGIIAGIMDTLGTEDPVYLSVDIDVLDPAFAPGTGTPEPGGWTTRELIRVLRGVEGLNLVGADVVEVAPAYQGAGEETALAAAQVVYEIATSMVKRGLTDMPRQQVPANDEERDEL